MSRVEWLAVGRSLGLASNSLSSWYSLRPQDLAHIDTNAIKSKIWIHQQLSLAFPEHSWERSKFRNFADPVQRTPHVSLRAALVEIGKDLGIEEGQYEKWYGVSNRDIHKRGGKSILARFENAKWKMLLSLFPEHKWDLNAFPKKPDRHWKSNESQNEIISRIQSKLGIGPRDYEAWYRVRSRDIWSVGCSAFLLQHNNSVSRMVSKVFPEHNWDLKKFAKKPNNYWDSLEVQRTLLNTIGIKLGIPEGDFEGWYKVTGHYIKKHGGEVLFNKKYSSSISKMLRAVFPEHTWDEAKFLIKPREYWSSTLRQKEFLLELGAKLGFKQGDLESWYKVSREDFIKNGGGVLLELYGGPRLLLTSVFSDHEWHPWKFSHFQGQWFWKDADARLMVANYVEESLHFKDIDGWSRVTLKELKKLGLDGILRTEASVIKFLSLVYPERDWKSIKS